MIDPVVSPPVDPAAVASFFARARAWLAAHKMAAAAIAAGIAGFVLSAILF